MDTDLPCATLGLADLCHVLLKLLIFKVAGKNLLNYFQRRHHQPLKTGYPCNYEILQQ